MAFVLPLVLLCFAPAITTAQVNANFYNYGTGCNSGATPGSASSSGVTIKQVHDAQKAWGDGIIAIGKAFTANENFEQVASDLLDALYGYNTPPYEVLFKPTLASVDQFRPTKESAMSYFVAQNGLHPEDSGFALAPWSNVRFENHNILLRGDVALAMGNYYFTNANTGAVSKVEYTFAYAPDEAGNLRIILHKSTIPFNPEA
eukprot:TRINITY_DN107287_c0_g1_i1.p1 TRINITY_DN107287_c0_g1~~TRINITY_DN107287_c0_g1_i1.p1  ORF type:complete len:222 (-),score=35.35 TRINITY_DN107287_c0_g1_i1:113-721(-)